MSKMPPVCECVKGIDERLIEKTETETETETKDYYGSNADKTDIYIYYSKFLYVECSS